MSPRVEAQPASPASSAEQANAAALLTGAEVAERLRVSCWFVYDHAAELGRVKVGRSNRYLAAAVNAYIARAGETASTQPATEARPPSAPPEAPAARPSAAGRRQRSPRKSTRRVALLDPATDLRPLRDT